MRPCARALELLFALVALGAAVFSAAMARAFPGVLVSVTETPPKITTTELVVMEHAGVSIVTLAVDYQGPFERFALVTLVPRDVEQSRLRTVKHEFIARLEQLTAPRVFEFWEQDPCVPGEPEQAWQEKVAVKNRGFLTPDVMPPRDAHYPVSNELAIPAAPVFKETEDEFGYRLLRPKSRAELSGWLEKRGYQVSPGVLEPLIGALGSETQVLVAEVAVDRAELIDNERLQLGGIRYWSRRPLLPILETLGRAQRSPHHDLFVYALHREKRYQAANLANVFAPTNLRVTADLGARVGPLYATLFERLQNSRPAAAVTEFVGPSDECGEPCANAPLELRELLTFGGDVLETHTPVKDESPAPAAALAASAATPAELGPAKKKQQQDLEKQLAVKRSLLARQRYIVTRLHLRESATTAPTDLELAPSDAHQSGGYGVPRGPNAELALGVRPANASRYQVRFHAVHPWQGALPCAKPERWRWGKRWKSETQHWRGVHVARDLPRIHPDPKLVDTVLLSAVPDLGLKPPAPSPSPSSRPEPDHEEPEASSCSHGCRGTGGVAGLAVIWMAVFVYWRRRSVGTGASPKPRG